MDKLTGSQARAARAMLAWSVRRLAQQCEISDSSIRRIEASFDVPEVSLDTLTKLKEFYESRGFRFFRDESGPGVQWRRSSRSSIDRRGGGSGNVKTRSRGNGVELRT